MQSKKKKLQCFDVGAAAYMHTNTHYFHPFSGLISSSVQKRHEYHSKQQCACYSGIEVHSIICSMTEHHVIGIMVSGLAIGCAQHIPMA